MRKTELAAKQYQQLVTHAAAARGARHESAKRVLDRDAAGAPAARRASCCCIVLEIVGRRPRGALGARRCVVVGAPPPCRGLAVASTGYAAAPFAGPVLGRRRPRSLAKAMVLALARAGAADVARRLRRRRPVLPAAAVVAVRRLPAAVGGQLPDAVPRARDHVAAGVRAGAAGLPAAGERRGGAQVPGAGRHGDRDVPDGRLAALRRQRLAGARDLRRGARLAPTRWRRAAVVLVIARLLPEGRDRAVPRLGARRLRGRERAGHRVHGDDRQGRRAARRGAPVRHRAGVARR